jgi:hypothetical protein
MSAFGASLVDDASASAARATLGLGTAATENATAFDAAGSSAAVNSTLSTHVALATAHGISSFGSTLVDDIDAANARGTLGLGTIATQSSSSVTITGGSVTGITDIAIADGGTGASTAAGARTNLGLVIGTDVQAYDATLAALAGWSWSSGTEVPTFGADNTLSVLRVGTGANNLLKLSATPGTPDGTKVLRDDMTWVAQSGGSFSPTITSPASGQYVRYSGSAWVNSAIQAGDIPSGFNLTGQSIFSANTNYTGTSGAFTVEPCTITFPSTGCYRVTALIPLRILVAATVTSQLACGTCAISHANGDVIGTCDNSRAGSVAACTVSTGSPTTISLASRPDIANMAWLGELIIDVTTAGTMKLQLAGAGSTANHFTVLKGAMLRWEKVS